MDKINFEEIYNESAELERTEKKETTPFEDTPQAWYGLDTTGPESEDVVCGNFVWHREKSNNNLKDTGDGKGFSFYLARYVFDDPYSVEIENETHPENDKTLGVVLENKVMVVVNAKVENDKIRIISAWEASAKNDVEHYKLYEIHRKIIDNLKNKTRVVESVSSTYYVLRKAIGKSFDENSYGIVADSNDVSEPINRIATYNGKKVYVQKIGSKPECERLAEMIKFGLDHYSRGKTW